MGFFMPILSPKSKAIEKSVKLSINSELLEKINGYCDFAQLESLDEFFNGAAQFVLSKDSEWKKHTKASKK
jgi:hypothetical protein